MLWGWEVSCLTSDTAPAVPLTRITQQGPVQGLSNPSLPQPAGQLLFLPGASSSL